MKYNIAIPYSSIYNELPHEFLKNLKTIELKDFKKINFSNDFILHSGLSLLSDEFIPVIESSNALHLIKGKKIRRFSFDIGSRFKNVKIINNQYVGIGEPLIKQDICNIIYEKLFWLKNRIPEFCQIAIENLNYYPSGAYEEVCEPEFYNFICREYEIGLVLDIAHAEVSAINKGVIFEEYINKFDLSLIKEIHVSKCGIEGSTAYDVHNCPDEHEFYFLKKLLTGIEANVDIVIEYYKKPDYVVSSYNKMAEMLNVLK
jgi:uncharacterized protein